MRFNSNLRLPAAVAAGAFLLTSVPGANALEKVARIPLGHCAPVVYRDLEGNRISVPMPGSNPVRVERDANAWIEVTDAQTGEVRAIRLAELGYEGPRQQFSEVTVRAPLSTITIVNTDDPGEGLNDPTARAAVGGNPGTTLGAQRLNSMVNAANELANILASGVEIRVDTQFNPLACDSFSAILGSAGPNGFFRNFSGAPLSDTHYAVALANKLNGSDLDVGFEDINATFNSDVDNNNSCLMNTNWYYGFDGNPSGNDEDFTTTALHEMVHGMGFTSLVDETDGSQFIGLTDAFSANLFDEATGRFWGDAAETNGNRAASAISVTGLTWGGAMVTAGNSFLTAGNNGAGRTRMYAPNPIEPGSSVSHFDESLLPNELMEPQSDPSPLDMRLTNRALGDMGWTGLVPVELSAFSLE